MFEKPTYEELEQKIKALKEEHSVHKNIEAALRESKENYRLLVKNLPSIVYKGYKDWSVEFFDEKQEPVWMKRHCNGYSNHFLLQKRWEEASAWGLHLFMELSRITGDS